MRILFIDFNLPYLLKDVSYPAGGWAVELSAWIKGLRAGGHQVGVATWKGANRYVGKNTDFDLIETYDPAKGLKVIKYVYDYIPVLFKKAAEYSPDVIIQACAELNTGIMAFVAHRLKTPFVYRVANDMDTDHRCREDMVIHARMSYEYGLKNADAVLCQNQYQYDNIKKRFPGKAAAILYNPFCQAGPVTTVSFDRRRYIAWLGVFKKQKNLPLLYRIAHQMPEQYFKVAGMPGKKVDKDTADALRTLENLPNVEFTGYLSRDKIFPFLTEARALLNTSHYEGFSNAFLEAFSVGTPVIAPVHSDPDHVIQKNGLGAAVLNETDFPARINHICADKLRFNEISRKCLEYVTANHDPEILGQRLVEFVLQVGNQFDRKPLKYK